MHLLGAFEKKCDALLDVLKNPKLYSLELNDMGVLTSEKLQMAIVDDRKYISSQFSKEISRETKRMKYCQYAVDLKKKSSENKSQYTVLEPLVKEIVTVLTTRVYYNETLIVSAIRTALNCLRNDTATEHSNVESKEEQLRQERDVYKSQQQIVALTEKKQNI